MIVEAERLRDSPFLVAETVQGPSLPLESVDDIPTSRKIGCQRVFEGEIEDLVAQARYGP